MHGLSTKGEGGNNEPALSAILATLGYGVDVGWVGLAPPSDPLGPAPKGQEVIARQFRRAGPGAVGLVALARFSPAAQVPFGWFDSGAGAATTVAALALSPNQTLLPPIVDGGAMSFDPGAATFSIFVQVPDHTVYTDDARNTGAATHGSRIYPARDRVGVLIPNAYLVTFEEASNGDYQDYVFLLTNVVPAN